MYSKFKSSKGRPQATRTGQDLERISRGLGEDLKRICRGSEIWEDVGEIRERSGKDLGIK